MKTPALLKEYRPAIRFLLIFVSVYFLLNIIYGVWIGSLDSRVDIVTIWASEQSVGLANLLGHKAHIAPNDKEPKISMMSGDRVILNVFEGCNGLNVMIVFLAFIVAFGGSPMKMIWFVPLGLLIIHLSNLIRILLLYLLSNSNSTYFYYFHKYFFTAAIYVTVFILWWLWIILNNAKGAAITTKTI